MTTNNNQQQPQHKKNADNNHNTRTTTQEQHNNKTTIQQRTGDNKISWYIVVVSIYQIKSLLFNKYFYLTIFLKLTLFYCIPNFFIANGFVAVGCYSWLLYTKYFYC